MKRSLEKIFKVLFIIIVITALAVPQPVLAQDVVPTDAPPIATEVVTEVVTEAPVVEVTIEPTEGVTEVVTEVVVETAAPTEVIVETIVPTEVPVIEEETTAEVVELLNAEGMTLTDADGEALAFGSQEAAEVIASSDPFFYNETVQTIGAQTLPVGWVGYTVSGTGCPTGVTCLAAATPFQATVTAALNNTSDTTIYVASGVYAEDVTIDAMDAPTKVLSFEGFNSVSVSGGLATVTNPGFATVNQFTLNANFGITNGVFGNSILVNSGGYLSDALALVNPLNTEATITADIRLVDQNSGIPGDQKTILVQDAYHSSDTKYEWECGEPGEDIGDNVYHMILKSPYSQGDSTYNNNDRYDGIIDYYIDDIGGSENISSVTYRMDHLIMAAYASETGNWSNDDEEMVFWYLLGQRNYSSLSATQKGYVDTIINTTPHNNNSLNLNAWFLWPNQECDDWDSTGDAAYCSHSSHHSEQSCKDGGHTWYPVIVGPHCEDWDSISPNNTQLSFLKLGIPATGDDDKITICHVAGRADDPANFITLDLPYNAVYANAQGNGGHFNQNGTPTAGHEDDYLGPCIDVCNNIAGNQQTMPAGMISDGLGGCITPAPALSFVKSVSPATYDDVGDVLSYQYLVTNTGNVNLTGLTATDNKVTVTCPVSSLVVGASTTCTASYTIGQTDLDIGSVINIAHADALFGTVPVASPTDTETATAVQRRGLSIVKTVSPSTYDEVGDLLSYSYAVKNTGNVTLNGPFTVADNKATVTCPATATLAPEATVTCTASYTIGQADLDAGSVTNVAFASNGTVTSPTDTETATAVQRRGLSIVKTVSPATYDEVGDLLSYSYAVKNVGNVTLSGPFTVADNKATVTCPATPTLAPNATVTCTASYTIGQADLDAGSVTNVASASNGTVTSASDSETATAKTTSALSIIKTVSPATYDSVGDLLSYSYVVKNAGNVTLSGPFTVADNKATVTCPATATLAPEATITCTATYTIGQADLDAGSVTNVASASNGTVTSPTDTETATADQISGLLVLKTVTSTGPYVAGSTIAYSLVITNTGNVTLTDVAVTDPKAAIIGTCSAASLAPAASFTCSASHVVSALDIAAGLSYLNTATATSGKTSAEGSVTSTLDILGCMDPTATNYNASATIADGSCTYPTVLVPVTGATPALAIPVTGGAPIPVTGGTLIVSGLGHSCMTYNNGQVICWGLNASGQLGDGTTVNKLEPVYVKDLVGVQNLTAGGKHTCALTIDGEIWCWGENSSGQLGNGTTTNSSVPVKVTDLPAKVLNITAGEEFTCVQLMNQEVWCWGKNNLGQLNDGTTTNQTSPVKSKLTTMLAQISGGQGLLLGSDVLGGVNEWVKAQAAAVKQLTSSLSISANRWGDTGCAVAADGSVNCWGSDLISIPVTGALPAMEVGTGLDHNCSINTDESVSCWGSNGSGQLGDGTNKDSASATLVKNLNLAHALAVGAHHTCILSGTSNIAYCWGENTFGQLGNSSTDNSNVPVLVVLPK